MEQLSPEYRNIHVRRVQGQPGLGHYRIQFAVHFDIHPAGEETVWLHSITGHLSVRGKGGQEFVGRLWPVDASRVLQTFRDPSEAEVLYMIDLSARQVEGIEALRQAGDLTFTLNLQAARQRTSELYDVSAPVEFLCNQGDWTRVLRQIDYQATLLIEIPLTSTNEIVAPALAHLRGAQELLAAGRYRDVVGACRDALEALFQRIEGGKPSRGELRALFQESRELTKEGRYKLLHLAGFTLASAARHSDEVAERIAWDRADAIASLALIGSLVVRHQHDPVARTE